MDSNRTDKIERKKKQQTNGSMLKDKVTQIKWYMQKQIAVDIFNGI